MKGKLLAIESKYGVTRTNMAISYLFDKGISVVKQITDEDVSNMVSTLEEKEKESPNNVSVMTPTFQGELVNVAREIAMLNLFEDILPYIRHHMMFSPSMARITIRQNEVHDELWDDILTALDYDLDEYEHNSIEVRMVEEC